MPKVKLFDKTEVLEKASEIFRTKGYNGTSIDDLLTATGLSRSSLYDTFQDKHNLYVESLNHYKNKASHPLEDLKARNISGLKKIELLLEGVVKHITSSPHANGCLMVNAAAEMSKQCKETSNVICNAKKDMEKLLEEWIKVGQEEGLINVKQPAKAYSLFLYTNICGLRVMSQSGADKKELEHVVKVMVQSIK
jgi:TetR/AcrR family transcriptional regulator, transcriptional repressor for nem operon